MAAQQQQPPLRVSLPRVMFGTSTLGNLYQAVPHADKLAVVARIVEALPLAGAAGGGAGLGTTMFDSAGKYGAGLALEELGTCLRELGVDPSEVLISNKLAWKRAPLLTEEPTFEPGAWVGLAHDAEQDISYQGILDCYREGNALLGEYDARIVSVHDPDEYLSAAADAADLEKRRRDVLEAYRALQELKDAGEVDSIGVGAKDISAIDWISDHVQLDWAMFACSMTVKSHGPLARGLLKKLGGQGVAVINSAVFNGGFLIGGEFFDYRKLTPEADPEMFAWRDAFRALCDEFGVKATAACVQFSFLFPAIKSVALATSRPSRVAGNIELVNTVVPKAFWLEAQKRGLISEEINLA
jgi:D-threo-aldose 1-dehydrogenase